MDCELSECPQTPFERIMSAEDFRDDLDSVFHRNVRKTIDAYRAKNSSKNDVALFVMYQWKAQVTN